MASPTTPVRTWRDWWPTVHTATEERKAILTNSLIVAFRRCLIHVLPLATSTLILYLNIKGVYIGVDFGGPIKSETINLMLLQIAAKVNEILVVSSLGFILLQLVRHELLFGSGLPLGLIGSGLAFSNFQFFFKSEFYGAMRFLATGEHTYRRIIFVIALTTCGVIAALAGPASAVLIVPRSQTWESGGTDYYLPGDVGDFWPTDVSADLVDLQQYCANTNSTAFGICPAGGFFSLLEYWNRVNYTNFRHQTVAPFAKELSGSQFYWPVHSPASQLPPLYMLGGSRSVNLPMYNTFLIQPHAAVAGTLQRIGSDWWRSLLSKRSLRPNLVDDRAIQSKAPSAVVTVRCGLPQNLSISDNTILFPSIQGRFDYSLSLNLTVPELDASVSTHAKFQWIHLPEVFGATSIGAIFQSPWLDNGLSRIVIGCTAQAGWVPTTIFTNQYTFWSGWYAWDIDFGKRTPAWSPDASSSLSNGRIALSDAWLDLLTPESPIAFATTPYEQRSTIESILDIAGFSEGFSTTAGSPIDDWMQLEVASPVRCPLLESIIGSVLVDGLSRSGSHRLFNKTGQPSEWSAASYNPLPDFSDRILANENAFLFPANVGAAVVTGHVSMQITGFALQKSLAVYLSMSVLLVHMFLAVSHTAYVLLRRHTSRSWNSVGELVALAQNSRPALQALTNVAGGIRHPGTFATIAKIRVKRNPQTGAFDHVELVFQDSNDMQFSDKDNKAPEEDFQQEGEVPLELVRRQARPVSTRALASGRLSVPETHGRSPSTERLISQVSLATEPEDAVVRVNEKYS